MEEFLVDKTTTIFAKMYAVYIRPTRFARLVQLRIQVRYNCHQKSRNEFFIWLFE
jgi:hypothetical protein